MCANYNVGFLLFKEVNMGSYSDEQRAIIFYENHKDDYDEKLLKIKYFFRIPVIWIKKNKYTKTYYLFNIIPVFSVTKY